MRSGTAYLLVKGEPRQSVRLKLTEDTLFIQKQEYATHLALTENIDSSLLDKVNFIKFEICHHHKIYRYQLDVFQDQKSDEYHQKSQNITIPVYQIISIIYFFF